MTVSACLQTAWRVPFLRLAAGSSADGLLAVVEEVLVIVVVLVLVAAALVSRS